MGDQMGLEIQNTDKNGKAYSNSAEIGNEKYGNRLEQGRGNWYKIVECPQNDHLCICLL
jgi:hypothetical protein